MLWSLIGRRFPAAETRSTAGSLCPYQCPCGTILLTLYSMVLDGRGSRSGRFFLLAYAAQSLFVFYYFSLSLLSVYRFLLGFVGPTGCRSVSPSLALPTSFNNNDNNTLCCQHSAQPVNTNDLIGLKYQINTLIIIIIW